MQSSVVSNTISLIISKLIPSALLVLINIIYSRYLSHADYGLYQILWTYINIFIIITTFGLPRYILTFGNLYNYPAKDIIKLSFVVFALTVIPIAIYFIAFEKNFDFITTILFLILLISQSLYIIQESNVVSLIANKILVFSNLIYALLLFIIHMIVLYYGYDLKLCILLIILVSVIRNSIIKYALVKHVAFSEKIKKQINKIQLIWFGLNDTLQIVTKWIDKLLLIAFLPSTEYAIYFNGTYEIPLIGIALSAFQTIITVQSAKAESTEEKNIELFNTSSIFMAGILFPLFSLCYIYAYDIITLFYTRSYIESVQLFAISSLLIPMRICNYTVLLQLKSKGLIILTGSLIDFFITILLMIILYPQFRLSGLAMAVVIATYIQAAFYLFKITRIYNKSLFDLFDLKKIIPVFLISFVPLLAIKLLLGTQLPGTTFILACIIAVVTSIYFVNKKFDLKDLFFRKIF